MQKKEPVDLFKFYLTHLLDPKDRYNAHRRDEAVNYFLQLVYDGPKSEVLAKVPRPMNDFPLLDATYYKPDDPVMKIVNGLFLDSLRVFLTDALGHAKNDYRRVNAYRLLQPKGLSPDMLMLYHSTNILEWDSRFRATFVLESMEFFEQLQPPAKPVPEVPEMLKKIQEKALKVSESMKKAEEFEEEKEWLRFSEAAKRALTNLKTGR
jgi:hypothetical protein